MGFSDFQSQILTRTVIIRSESRDLTLNILISPILMRVVTAKGLLLTPIPTISTSSPSTGTITNLREGFSYTKPDGMSWKDYLKDNAYSYCSLKLQAMQQIEAIAVTEEGYYSTSECSKCPIWYYRNN